MQISISNAIKGQTSSGGGSSFENLYSFEFNGVDDYVDCGDNDNLSFGNGTTDSPFSISAWVNMTDASKFRIISKYASSNQEYLLATDSTDKIVFTLYDDSKGGTISRKYNTALTSFEGQWIHLAFTYSGNSLNSGLKIYLNGTQVDNLDNGTGSYTAMENTTQPLEIGKLTTSYANGKIDEVAIFNSELSASDVTTIYNGGLPNDLSSLSPISWWRMGDAATWTGRNWDLIDQGSGGNNGFSDTIPGPPAQPSTDVPT